MPGEKDLTLRFSNPAHVGCEIIDGLAAEIEEEFNRRVDLFSQGGTYFVRILSTALTQLDIGEPLNGGLRYSLAVIMERS